MDANPCVTQGYRSCNIQKNPLNWLASNAPRLGLMWKWKDASLLFHFSSLCKCKRFLEGCFPCYRIFENLLPEANKSVKGVPNGHISHIFYKSPRTQGLGWPKVPQSQKTFRATSSTRVFCQKGEENALKYPKSWWLGSALCCPIWGLIYLMDIRAKMPFFAGFHFWPL